MLQDVFTGWLSSNTQNIQNISGLTFSFQIEIVHPLNDNLYNCRSQFNRINALPTTVHQHISKMNIKPDLLSRPTSRSRTGLDAPREKNAVWPLRTLLALVRGGSCFCTHIIIFNGVKNGSIFWMFVHLTISLQAFTIWQRKSTTRKNDLMLFP